MRHTTVVTTTLVSILTLTACAEQPTATLPVLEEGPQLGIVHNGGRHGTAQLSGANEVPSRDTRARGAAEFRRTDDGAALHYRLIVANIENVVQAHIHLGPAGQNGPVTAFLFGPVPAGGGRVDGEIANGTLTASNLIGPLAGMTLDDLLAEMLAGNAYVNVHTNDGVAPTNTGPGDFPGGEVRGQIR